MARTRKNCTVSNKFRESVQESPNSLYPSRVFFPETAHTCEFRNKASAFGEIANVSAYTQSSRLLPSRTTEEACNHDRTGLDSDNFATKCFRSTADRKSTHGVDKFVSHKLGDFPVSAHNARPPSTTTRIGLTFRARSV